MLSKVHACAIKGIDGFLVSVEVDIAPGMPTLSVVGLPDTEVKESKERVIAALRNSGFDFPLKRITVNLSPAELRKSGTQFDLPIAEIPEDRVAILIDTRYFAFSIDIYNQVRSAYPELALNVILQNQSECISLMKSIYCLYPMMK